MTHELYTIFVSDSIQQTPDEYCCINEESGVCLTSFVRQLCGPLLRAFIVLRSFYVFVGQLNYCRSLSPYPKIRLGLLRKFTSMLI